MWFQQPDAFTLARFRLECGPDHLLKWFERLPIGFKSVSNAFQWTFTPGLFTIGLLSNPRKRMKWPGVNSPIETRLYLAHVLFATTFSVAQRCPVLLLGGHFPVGSTRPEPAKQGLKDH